MKKEARISLLTYLFLTLGLYSSIYTSDHKITIEPILPQSTIEILETELLLDHKQPKPKIQPAPSKRARNFVDLSHIEFLHICDFFLNPKNAGELVEGLKALFKLKRISKKFNSILLSETFKNFVRRNYKPDRYRYTSPKSIWISNYVNSKDEQLSPLHMALRANNVPLIQFLIELGSDVNALSGKFGSMHYVQSIEAFKLLQAAGINYNMPVVDMPILNDKSDKNPLFFIAKNFGYNHALTHYIIQKSNADKLSLQEELAIYEREDRKIVAKYCCCGFLIIGVLIWPIVIFIIGAVRANA